MAKPGKKTAQRLSPSPGRVVILVLDALGPEFVTPDRTPHLIRLAESGGIAPAGGLAELVASTGPGHAALLTGQPATAHGVLANRIFDEDGRPVERFAVRVPTVLDRAWEAGRSTAIAVSDPDVLVTVRGDTAEFAWPRPEEVATGAHPRTGYMPDARTLDETVRAIQSGYDLVIAQLQEIDTALHAGGIDGERTREAHAAADAAVAEIVAALEPEWARTLLVVVSDHRAEDLVHTEPVRLAEALDGVAAVIEDGSAALIRASGDDLGAVFTRAQSCPGLAALVPVDRRQLIAWSEPGRVFGRGVILSRAAHGNGTTRPCLAVVAGGHPLVPDVAARIRQSPPPLSFWAGPAMTVLLGDQAFPRRHRSTSVSPTPSEPAIASLPRDDDTNRSPRRAAWQRQNAQPDIDALLARDTRAFLAQALSTPCLSALRDARGVYVEDLAGRRYLDFHGNTVHHIGYAHPRLLQALKTQLDGLTFSPRRYTNEPAVALAEALTAVAPGDLAKCLFAPSGNDAIEIALRIARGVTGRYKTIAFWGAYHGAGVAAASVGGEAMFRGRSAGPLTPGTSHVLPPTCYRCPFGHRPASGCCMMTVQAIRATLEAEQDVAAVVAAPMHGAEFVPAPGFWQEVRRACDEHGALLVFDEVQTGLGKTGRMFACELDGVVPDVLVVGKALGGAVVPLAAAITRERFDRFGDEAIGHYTHEKNPFLATAGLTTLEIIRDEGLVARAARLGEQARQLASALAERHSLVGDVRGRGLQLGIELVRDRETREPARAAAEAVMYAALDRGLSIKVSGGSILALSPPLIITPAELERAFAILDECLTQVEEGPVG